MPSVGECNHMSGDTVERFIYQDAEGRISYKELDVERRTDEYLEGHYLTTGNRRTFRIDRILETLTEGDDPSVRVRHYQKDAPPIKRRAPDVAGQKRRKGVVVCFTGFKAALRSGLEKTATDVGFHVAKSVTQDLTFLVAGITAGPKKLSKANGMGVQLLDEHEFELMASTGEVPF